MGVNTQVCRAFNAAIVSALMLGLGVEAVHAIHHPPQPHTDQHERIEYKMNRLREAEINRIMPKATACGTGLVPPQPDLFLLRRI